MKVYNESNINVESVFLLELKIIENLRIKIHFNYKY